MTGVSLIGSTLEAKRLEMLHRLLPSAATIGALVNPNYPDAQFELTELKRGAQAIGLKIHVRECQVEKNKCPTAFVSFFVMRMSAHCLSPLTYSLLGQREQNRRIGRSLISCQQCMGFREIRQVGAVS